MRRPASKIEYSPARWCPYELHLGSLAWEVPGLVCFLATLMAEAHISILNLSSHDRDFLLVQEADVHSAKRVIQQRLPRVSDGLKEAITEKAIVRRSGTFNSFSSGGSERDELLALLESEQRERQAAEKPATAAAHVATGDGITNGNSSADVAAGAAALASSAAAAGEGREGGVSRDVGNGVGSSQGGCVSAAQAAATVVSMPKIKSASRELLDQGGGLFVRVLPTSLAVVRLHRTMLVSSTHALITRLLFTQSRGSQCFWSFTQTDGEISLIIDEHSLPSFPEDALVGSSSRWRPLRLCGRSFAFDETGVVSAMYAPYEDGMQLLNFSTFSTNVSLVEEADLERALASFDMPVLRPNDDAGNDNAGGVVDVSEPR